MTDAKSKSSESGLHLRPLPRVGQELGRFIIERELPRGGQARVYRAWQVDLQRPVALKLLPISFVKDDDAAGRFRNEIENVARLSHPNIVRVYEAGEMDGQPYFTMEFIEGEDGEALIKKGPLEPDDAAAIIEAVSRAIAQAHAKGIIHRDIKPGNIIVKSDGTPILTDFGLAQDLTHSDQLTRTGISMGTPAYMSPEQARGERDRVGVKSDLYALGATLYTLLTCKRPVEGESAYEIMMKVAELKAPKWPRELKEDIPADLRAIVEMAMQNEPSQRYSDATGLADDLERFQRGEWVVARSRSAIVKALIRSRRYVSVAVVAAVTIALAVGMIVSTGTEANESRFDYGKKDLINRDRPPAEDETLTLDLWNTKGAIATWGPGRELVLRREGGDVIELSPRDAICWGDFTVETLFRVEGLKGELSFRVGMAPDGLPEDTAYTLVLRAHSQTRFELRRLGVALSAGTIEPATALTDPGAWYRATIVRRGGTIEFTVAPENGPPIASVSLQDIFPALVSGMRDGKEFQRRHFGLSADAALLSVRNLTVVHRDSGYSTEDELLFWLSAYPESELRLSARLSKPLPFDADAAAKNQRARLLFLRARCLLRRDSAEGARKDLAESLILVQDRALRSRILLLSSSLDTDEGNDQGALRQLYAARRAAGLLPGFASRVDHEALARARRLETTGDPQRALAYYAFVSANASGDGFLMCRSLYRGALLQLLPEGDTEEALIKLRRIRRQNDVLGRYGDTFVPAMATLFDLRWQEISTGEIPPYETGVSATVELEMVAQVLNARAGAYGVDPRLILPRLVRAAWLTRLSADFSDDTAITARWLRTARVGAEATDALWIDVQLALQAEERPGDRSPAELAEMWKSLEAKLNANETDHKPLFAVVDFFKSDGTSSDVRRFLQDLDGFSEMEAGHWIADASIEAFVDYCGGLKSLRTSVTLAGDKIERASSHTDPGAFRVLKDRVLDWLPADIRDG